MKILFCFFLFVQTLAASERSIYLGPGQETQLAVPQTFTLKMQKTDVIQVFSQKSKVRIKAKKLGVASLIINNDFYSVVVLAQREFQFLQELQDIQNEILGIRVLYRNKKIQLLGTLYKTAELSKIVALQKKYQVPFENHLNVVDEITESVRQIISNEFIKQKLPIESVLFTQPWSARAQKIQEKNQALEILHMFGAELVADPTALEVKPLIKVEIVVAELKKDFKRTLGLKWPTSFTAEVLADGSRQYSDLIFQADALENRGFGKLLAKPNILCRSGSDAEFLAGGEFPIKILNYKTQDVIWKKYGVLLQVHPQADQSGRISLQIKTEISSIDMSRAVDGIPGLFTNKVSSHFDLKKSQTIALSGMIKSENQHQSQGLPWLSQIPVLGALFSSKDYVENKSELVIFVRPSIVLKEESL